MSCKELVITIALIACLTISASAQGPKNFQTQKEVDPLGGGLGWMNIPSVEHTQQYLEMTGGMGGDPTAVTGVNVAGNWTFELRDRYTRNMDVHLYQSGTVVFGVGTVKSMEGTQAVTLEGYLSEGGLYLSAVTVGINPDAINLYKMTLTGSALSASGSFSGFNAAGGGWSGSVTGSKVGQRSLS